MANNTGKGQFVKGDPRCWRKGKPKEFNALRDLAQAVLAEEALNQGQAIIINGHKATGAEVIIRQWMQSKDFQKQKGLLEIAFGKVPDEVKVNASGALEIRYTNDWRRDTPAPTPGAEDSPIEPCPLSLVDGRPSLAQDDAGHEPRA